MNFFALAAAALLPAVSFAMPSHPIETARGLVRAPLARTADFHDEIGLTVAMLGDSTARDFAIASNTDMLAAQWLRYQNDPFLNTDAANGIDSVFERLAR